MKKSYINCALVGAAVALGISGCSALITSSSVLDKFTNGINTYCSEVSEVERKSIRDMLNSDSKHKIEVTCSNKED